MPKRVANKTIRVFPRRTNATPDDDMAIVGPPPLFPIEAERVEVSCVLTWDKMKAEWLADEWCKAGYENVELGGPAYDDPGKEFVPGKYVKTGYVITSRGCNNKCWFCDAWKREGKLRELPITEGWNVLDNNLLQCGEKHIRTVFAMLIRQQRRAEFTGGLEAAALRDWHIDLLVELKPKQIFFAYDTPDDYEPLVLAGRELLNAGFTEASHSLRCYVLIGYPKDTFELAEVRLNETLKLGFTPMAMLWRDCNGNTGYGWGKFQRLWARPSLIHGRN